MTDQVLNVLKFVLLGMVYLFFARVLWAVWSEVRAPVAGQTDAHAQRRGADTPPRVGAPAARAASAGSPSSVPSQQPPIRGETAGANYPPERGRSARGRRGSDRSAMRPARVKRLVIVEPVQRKGTQIPFDHEVTLGRDVGNTIVIDDDSFISQRHLRIFDYDGQPMLEDLESTNGTYHNGTRISGSRLLHPGDRIQVGAIVIEAQ